MTRPYWLGLAALWIVCAIAAWLYASEYQIPHGLVLALLPAFLLEAKFYLILGTESARVKVARMMPPAALALALTASAVAPYLAATLAVDRFDWRSFAILLVLFLVTAFWYVVLPHQALTDLAFVVLVAAVIAGKVFPELYPVPHRKIPLQILGQLALIRLGIFALLDLRGMKVGFGFIPQKRDWQIGALYFLLFLPVAVLVAPAIGFAELRMPQAAWWRVAIAAVMTFAGILWVVALSEEFVFRGLLQTWIGQWTKKPWVGLVAAALLFGSVHLGFREFPNWKFSALAACAGLFYGLAFRATGSIRTSMVTHALVVTTWRTFFA